MIIGLLICILFFLARERIKYTTGKTRTLWNHLKNDCVSCPQKVKARAKAVRGEAISDEELQPEAGASSTGNTSKQARDNDKPGFAKKPKLTQSAFQILQAPSIAFNKMRQEAFESDLVRMFATANFPLSSIEDPEVRKFLLKWIPGAKIPWAKSFGGPILSSEVSRLENEIKARAKGKLATVQCDGWKDVSRKHLVAFMFTAERKVSNVSTIVL